MVFLVPRFPVYIFKILLGGIFDDLRPCLHSPWPVSGVLPNKNHTVTALLCVEVLVEASRTIPARDPRALHERTVVLHDALEQMEAERGYRVPATPTTPDQGWTISFLGR